MSAVRIELPADFPPGARKLAFAEGRQILVFNIAGELVAIDNACPHAGGSLFGGKLEGSMLRCPSHGMRFDLCDDGGTLTRYPIERMESGAIVII